MKRHMQTERKQNALEHMQAPHSRGPNPAIPWTHRETTPNRGNLTASLDCQSYTSQQRKQAWKEANPPSDRCLDVKQRTIAAAIRSG